MSNPASVSTLFLEFFPRFFSRTTASFSSTPVSSTTTKTRSGTDVTTAPTCTTRRRSTRTTTGRATPAPWTSMGMVSGARPRLRKPRALCRLGELRPVFTNAGDHPHPAPLPGLGPAVGKSTPAASFPHRVLPALVSPLTPAIRSPRSPAPCPEQAELLRRVSRPPASPAACF